MAYLINKFLDWRKKRILKKIGRIGINFIWKGNYIECPENLIIGNNVYIGPGARIHASGGIEIEDGVICGPMLTIYTYNHNYFNAKYLPYDEVHLLKKVIVEKNVWIGDSVSIVPGVRIGEGSIIGMRSVITKDIPPFSVVGGNPARVLKTRKDIEHYRQLELKNLNYLQHKSEKNLKPIFKKIGN